MNWLTLFLLLAVIAGPLVVAEKAAAAASLALACFTAGYAWGLRLAGAGAMTSVQIAVFTIVVSIVIGIAFAILSQEGRASVRNTRNTRHTTCRRGR